MDGISFYILWGLEGGGGCVQVFWGRWFVLVGANTPISKKADLILHVHLYSWWYWYIQPRLCDCAFLMVKTWSYLTKPYFGNGMFSISGVKLNKLPNTFDATFCLVQQTASFIRRKGYIREISQNSHDFPLPFLPYRYFTFHVWIRMSRLYRFINRNQNPLTKSSQNMNKYENWTHDINVAYKEKVTSK